MNKQELEKIFGKDTDKVIRALSFAKIDLSLLLEKEDYCGDEMSFTQFFHYDKDGIDLELYISVDTFFNNSIDIEFSPKFIPFYD